MSKSYDAIIVGARCAGSPAAWLLLSTASAVLPSIAATFPSDTIGDARGATVRRRGAAPLGIADAVLTATGCPPIYT